MEKRKTVVSAVSTDEKKASIFNHFNYFSKYTRNVRVLAWIFRFHFNSRNGNNRNKGGLSGQEIERAENVILKMVQEEFLDKNSLKGLQIFEDSNGLLRVKSKLGLSDESHDFIYPILLPSNSDMMQKLIMETHQLIMHAGVQTTLCYLRRKFWILKGRKTVKNVLYKCVNCKKQKAKAAEPPFAPLPRDRLVNTNAFEISGVDLAGPLFLKTGEKAWIVLFTCAVFRAIHLELVSLS